MAPPRIEIAESVPQLTDSMRRFVEQLRWVKDPQATAIGYWSIAQTATHVAHIGEIFRDIAEGRGSPVTDPLKLDETWARMLAEDTERDLAVAGERITRSITGLLAALDDLDPMEELAWHAGLPVPRGCLAPIVINELELHGRDVALAEGRPWRLARVKAQLAIRGLGGVLPYFLDAEAASGLRAVYEIRLRGDGRIYAVVRDGVLEVTEAPPPKIDCHLSVDPVSYILVGYGRMPRLRAIATGKLVAWGRRPALALRFANLFVPP